MEAAVQQFEAACQRLQSDPMGAGQTLIQLRSDPHAVNIARHVLEHSAMPAAQFHAASLLQAALLGRWADLPLEERTAARNYVATLLLAAAPDRYPNFVRAQILQTFAVLWKRGWAEEGTEGKQEFFSQIQALAQQPDRAVLACGYLLALVGEFSSSKSAALGLPLEFHRQAHRAFESYGLLPCLELGMAMLGQALNDAMQTPAPSPLDAATLARLQSTAAVCVEVLSWDFGAFDPLHEPLASHSTFISPPIAWRACLLKPELADALLQVYVRVRTDPAQEERAHVLRQLLTQLASLQGPVFPTKEDRARLAARLIRGGVELLSEAVAAAGRGLEAGDEGAVNFYGKEVVALCQLAQTSVANFRLPILATFPFFPDLCQRLAGVAQQMLASTAAMAAAFRGSNSDFDELEHGWTMDGFDLLLETWVAIIEDPTLHLLTSPPSPELGASASGSSLSPIPPLDGGLIASDHGHEGNGGGGLGLSRSGSANAGGTVGGGKDFDVETVRRVVIEAAHPIYAAYQATRVTLGQVEACRAITEEEDEDDVEIAELGSHEQMRAIAALGRLQPMASLVYLKELLLDEGGGQGRGGGCLPRLHRLMVGEGGPGVDRSEMGVAALLEEVRVLVQACGHLLADDYLGEQPAIPDPIHRLCFQQQGEGSLSETIVGVVGSVHGLAQFLLQRAIAAPADPLLSPYLTEAVLWLLTRWARTYLLPDPKLYRNGIIAPPLLAAFGNSNNTHNGGGGAQLTHELMQLAWGFLTRWPTQSDVAESAIGLLRTLVSGSIGSTAMQLDAWRAILAALEAEGNLPPPTANGGPPQPPPPELGYVRLRSDVRGELLEVLVGGVLSREGDPAAGAALMQVAGPIEARLRRIVARLQQQQQQHQATGTKGSGGSMAVAQQVEEVAGLYAGLARAVDNSGQSLLTRLLTSALEPLVGAAAACPSYPEAMHAVLAFLRDYAEVHISSLGADATMALLQACGHALRAYAQQNLGRRRADANSKEEAVSDILCVLELLAHLASKDFVDFSEEGEGRLAADTVAEVVLFGLERLLPLMTEEYLDFPPLGKQYFTLVNSMVSTYTARVAALAHPLFMQLVQSVMFGVQRPDAEVARDSLRALAGLASFHAKAIQEDSGPGLSLHVQAQPQLLPDCMRKLLQMVVFEASIWDRLDAAANAILALVICDPPAFVTMVEGILEQQPPSVKERLAHEFRELISAIPQPPPLGQGRRAGIDRQTRLAFRDNLKTFAKRVRPFMQMR